VPIPLAPATSEKNVGELTRARVESTYMGSPGRRVCDVPSEGASPYFSVFFRGLAALRAVRICWVAWCKDTRVKYQFYLFSFDIGT